MLNKTLRNLFIVGFFAPLFCVAAFADVTDVDVSDDTEIVVTDEEQMEQESADAVASYDVNGSLFQQITDLEQEKVLMQLEKERAQLDLELDRLAAEKIKLHMEIESLSGRAEQAQKELENAKAKLDAETAKLEREMENLKEEKTNISSSSVKPNQQDISDNEQNDVDFSKIYKLVNVVGAGDELQATLEDLNNGQKKRISVGKLLEGYTVKSISLDEGVVLENDAGKKQNLNISSVK